MGKKKSDPDKKPTLQIKCNAADKVNFTRAAGVQNFDTLTAWMLFHLRGIAKDALKGDYIAPQ
jgi:hypothetical protein